MVYNSLAEPEKLEEQISVQSFRYEYGYRYGSSEKDKKDHKVMELIGEGPYVIVIDQLSEQDLRDKIRWKIACWKWAVDDRYECPAKIHYTLNRLKRPGTKYPATLSQKMTKLMWASKVILCNL